jgi:hypothetical protein
MLSAENIMLSAENTVISDDKILLSADNIVSSWCHKLITGPNSKQSTSFSIKHFRAKSSVLYSE